MEKMIKKEKTERLRERVRDSVIERGSDSEREREREREEEEEDL